MKKTELKKIIESLNPKIFDVKEIRVKSMKNMGVGESNLGYVFAIGNKKLICRVNIDKTRPKKSKEEYDVLKMIEPLNIAPKVYYLDKFGRFIILDYIEGKAMRMKKVTFSPKEIKQLARMLAKLHSRRIKGLKLEKKKYSSRLKEIKEAIISIKKFLKKKKYSEFLDDCYRFIAEVISNEKEEPKIGLVHGDVCPQNIIKTKNDLKLVDWESLQLSDPAKDIAFFLVEIKLSKKDLSLFLNEYKKHRKDSSLLKRAIVYAKLLAFVDLVWEILRSFEIINKTLDEEYLKKTNAQGHINEAQRRFRDCIKFGIIPSKWKEFDIKRLF
jgi:thiamine kinase-like enzyme